MFKNKSQSIDLSSNLISDWFYLDDYKSLIDEITINVNCSSVTGTLNGVLKIEALINDMDYYTLYSFNVNSASIIETIRTDTDVLGVRVNYVKNDVTGGNGNVVFILAGK